MIDFFSTLDGSLLPDLLRYHEDSPMIFSSGLFFVLFLLFLPIYGLLGLSKRTTTLRIIYVVCFSLFFYYKSSGFYVLLLMLATTSDFLIAQALSNTPKDSPNRKKWVALSMVINLGILSYFKYFNFLLDLVVQAFASIGGLMGMETVSTMQWEPWDIFLPVGISFYTFQTMSYIIDVYRGDIKPLRPLLRVVFSTAGGRAHCTSQRLHSTNTSPSVGYSWGIWARALPYPSGIIQKSRYFGLH